MGDRLLYDQLPRRCIRVLTVEATPHDNAQICGQLSIVDLDDLPRPRFSALSYVWGDANDQTLPMLCNKIVMPVLPNLHSALQNLRHTLGTFTIWIDAICIDQEDEEEKQHQIPLMGEIYAASQFVYVWLGIGSFQTKRAMKFLRDPPWLRYFEWEDKHKGYGVQIALLAYLSEAFKFEKTLFPRSSSQRLEHSPKSMGRASIQDLSVLLDAEWLERMWTYQEILLASNPIIVSGHEHLDWRSFSYTVAFLECSGCFNRSSIQIFSPLTGWFKIALARDYLRFVSTRRHRNNLRHNDSRPDSPLWSYINFIQAVVEAERTIIKIFVVIPLTTMLILSIMVALIGITDLANYRKVMQNIAFAENYNSRILSMIEAIVAAYTGTGTARAMAMTTTTVSSIVMNVTVTAQAPIATSVLDLLTRLHQDHWIKPTELMDDALSEMLPTIVSIVKSCQSGCVQCSTTGQCFTSCITSAPAMPTLQTIPFEDADVIAHMSLESYQARFWGVFVYTAVFMGFGLLAMLFGEFRRKVSIQAVSKPSELTLDLVDALLYRKARLAHDKAFALRNILHRLSESRIPNPNYRRPLTEIFAELNVQLSQAMDCNQMLVIASLIPLANHPSWMVDWSRKPDPFWLTGRGSSVKDIASDHYLDTRPETSKPTPRTWGVGRQLRCLVSEVCEIEHCFQTIDLRGGRALADAITDIRECMPNCKDHLRASLSRGAPGISRADIGSYVSFLSDENKWIENCFGYRWGGRSKLERTENGICDQFRKTGSILFMYKSELRQELRAGNKGPRDYYRYLFGICKENVRPGNVLIEVAGASTFLIVSNSSEARLISPAFVSGERMVPARARELVIV